MSYGSTWWNAKGEDIKAPENTELPTTPGETFDRAEGPSGPAPAVTTAFTKQEHVIARLDRAIQ